MALNILDFFSDILKSTDVTIIGILLSANVVMILFIRTLSKRINERDLYIREQDRSTLEILGGITSALKERNDNELGLRDVLLRVKDNVEDVKNITSSNNLTLNGLSTLIQAKLIQMDNGKQ